MNCVVKLSLFQVPSHAEETIVRDITLITAASKDLEAAKYVQKLSATTISASIPIQMWLESRQQVPLKILSLSELGLYTALGYGDNAKAAIITRGLAEITRLGVKLGASPLTYSGLSGSR